MQIIACRFFALVAVLLVAGCGSGEPKCVPVSGKVTLDGGPVPGPGFIYFNSDGTGKEITSRPGTAEFDAEGNYRAKTFTDGDGLLPGKYVIRVDCWKTPPNMQGKPVVSFLPPRYQDAAQSKLELTVEPGAKPITYNIDLSSK
jgi:hypothetical protein